MISKTYETKIKQKLEYIFGNNSQNIYKKLESVLEQFKSQNNPEYKLTQKDVFLITYGDSLLSDNETPLSSLDKFAKKYFKEIFSYIHILPFYPYSSDDGFSVINYYKVNPELGDWSDIHVLSKSFKLMFDGVINHISAKSDWFQAYLKGDPDFKDYFIEIDEEDDVSQVFRPRALPLATAFKTVNGEKKIWTTFSEDQIDLNFKSEDVFIEIIKVLLFYVANGAKAIRLDAIGFMWKKLGTNCIHLPETHKVIQLYKDIFEALKCDTLIITETNVPHKDNISYFGNGYNEAQLVYNFSLPPLTLYSIITGDASILSQWLSNLSTPSDETTFFNFLSSHDGIGVVPTHGILSDQQRDIIEKRVLENGGFVSYKNLSDGSKIPYEMNINYLDAVSDRSFNLDDNIKRFVLANSVLLSIIGVPAVYIHSILGSANYSAGVEKTGMNRTINREKLETSEVQTQLQDVNSKRHKVFARLSQLIKVRKAYKAFHPNSPQKVLNLDANVLAIIRGDENDKILYLANFSNKKLNIQIDTNILGNIEVLTDIMQDKVYKANNGLFDISLEVAEFVWLKL
ncbi:sugar phosphorylase [Francisella sp. 19X1-34]|uniref:sugar phosphorylase n=1 Tax=Francisella sp. 19X1-34 TaxID=3087177 RepID=UPI002E34F832|nr:sugar phosphorylase [Francisella sp. 19X1-34]MED7787882.1 sugar phosphorylase [Francisella sp. 19X1-34]